jgi:hypothetical protein
MTDVKALLEQATPLPWAVGKSVSHDGHNLYEPASSGDITSPDAHLSQPDAALIVYAVNHLPDYEAAVEALEVIAKEDALLEANPDAFDGHAARYMQSVARFALARLREKVPA